MIHRGIGLLRRNRRVRRGTYIVELAVILPVFLIFLLGTLDLAWIMYIYGTVSEAARGGARYAMVHGSMSSSPVGPTANDATVATQVKNYAPALNPADLTITSSWPIGNDATCPVTVTVKFLYQPAVGRLAPGLGSSITLSGSTTMLITH